MVAALATGSAGTTGVTDVPCVHCGLAVPARLLREDRAPFCCTGCFVAHGLSHRGLEGRTDRLLARVVLSAFLAMGVMVFSLSLYGRWLGEPGVDAGGDAAGALEGVFRLGALALSLPVLFLLGAPLAGAVVALRRWLSADSLVLVGAGAAWGVSAWNTFRGGGEVYFDTATIVLVLFGLGRWLDTRARERARSEIERLIPERERPALRLGPEGTAGAEEEVALEQLRIGDLVRVRAGEVVPVDGLVLEGRSFVDAAAMTGEQQPVSAGAGARVLAGTRTVDGTLLIRAEAVLGERLRDGVDALLARALASRGPTARLADRLAAWLLPLALGLAVLTAVLRWGTQGPERALLDALSVVLISCPCALGIATPLALWAAIGAAWRRGALVRGGEVLERLAQVRRVFLDKTGTLTSGELELVERLPAPGSSSEELLELAAALEVGSEHPIARALRRERARLGGSAPEVEGFRVLPGRGVAGRIAGRAYELTRAEEGDAAPGDDPRTRIELRRLDGAPGPGTLVGELRLLARPRPEARAVVDRLRGLGLELRVLTGDGSAAARALGATLDLAVDARLSPADKLERVAAAGPGTLFVGDGLNDAAALAAADVGVSMAGGSVTSQDAAPVNLLRPGLAALPEVIERARAGLRAARFNLLWAFAYNAIGLYLAASGRLTPVFAASAMVASNLVVVLTSTRLMAEREERPRPVGSDSAEPGSRSQPEAALRASRP